MRYYFPTLTDRRISSLFDFFKYMALRDRALALNIGFQVTQAEALMTSAAGVIEDRVQRWAAIFSRELYES